MKRLNLMGLIASAIVLTNMSYADGYLQADIDEMTKQQKFEDDLVLSKIAIKKCIKVGENTIKSLQANLAFITRVESNPNARKCVILEEKIAHIDHLSKSAKRLFENKEISNNKYQEFLSDMKRDKKKLEQNLNTKQCKKEK